MDKPDLTPRQWRVVELVGAGLSYKAAAQQMRHRYVEGRTVSPETVRDHAKAVRDRVAPNLSPREACAGVYWRFGDAWEKAGTPR